MTTGSTGTTATSSTDSNKNVVAQQNTIVGDATDYNLDRDWAKTAFLLPDSFLDARFKYDIKNRYWSTAARKFTDTRMGGSIGVNARPQFTPYSDIRVKGLLPTRSDVTLASVGGNYGMGRYYSEAIDDNAQTIYMRFGVPQFSSLTRFFKAAFDPNMTSLARTGRGKSAWFAIGEVVGIIASLVYFTPIAVALIAGRTISMFFTRPSSKFYTLKPTMHNYWSTVNMLVNTIAVNVGILPAIMTSETTNQTVGTAYKFDKAYLQQLHKMMPDVFTDGNGFDVFAMSNRAQRMANLMFEAQYKKIDNDNAGSYINAMNKTDVETIKPGSASGLAAWLNSVLLKSHGEFFKTYIGNETDDAKKMELSPQYDSKTGDQSAKHMNTFRDYFDAEWRDGGAFAAFRVDHTGAVNESFSNTAVESDLSQKFNGISSQSREARFSLAEGNLGDGLIAGTVQAVAGAAKDVVAGAANGLTLGVFQSLEGLAGSGFIDIPKHWQSSNVQLPKASYKIKLISPYNNPISIMQNIYIPLAMLLAGALPLSTGKASYTSPFICQLYDRGRCQIKLGMIDSLSISRGTSNLAFSKNGRPLAVDVNFSVTDFSSIMHMPISKGSLFGADQTLDEDNILMDYLAVLAGQDLYSQIYAFPKAKLALAKKINQFEKLTSPAYWASFSHDFAQEHVGFLSGIYEALLPGTSTISNSNT